MHFELLRPSKNAYFTSDTRLCAHTHTHHIAQSIFKCLNFFFGSSILYAPNNFVRAHSMFRLMGVSVFVIFFHSFNVNKRLQEFGVFFSCCVVHTHYPSEHNTDRHIKIWKRAGNISNEIARVSLQMLERNKANRNSISKHQRKIQQVKKFKWKYFWHVMLIFRKLAKKVESNSSSSYSNSSAKKKSHKININGNVILLYWGVCQNFNTF